MSRQHSIVPHKTNYFFLPLEDDYLAMYEDLASELDPAKEKAGEKLSGPSDCKAMIASVLEAWMNSKRPHAIGEEDLYVYFTYDEWEQAVRYRYKRSTIIQCLKEMETEGDYEDRDGRYGEPKRYQGTIKKRHFVQNTFEYQLNLPVVVALLEKLPEQSPFEQKPRPSLGRPKKNRVNKNRSEINGLNKNGINLDDGSVKIDGQSVKTNDSRPKINAPFYTQITQTQQTYTEGTQGRDSTPATPDAHASTPTQFVFQIQGWDRFYYHDFCIHEQDRGINDGLTLVVRSLSSVPQDAECSICYKPVHGPHGYWEIGADEEPYIPNFDYTQSPDEGRAEDSYSLETTADVSQSGLQGDLNEHHCAADAGIDRARVRSSGIGGLDGDGNRPASGGNTGHTRDVSGDDSPALAGDQDRATANKLPQSDRGSATDTQASSGGEQERIGAQAGGYVKDGEQEERKPKRTRTPRPPKEDAPEVAFTVEGRKVYDAWSSLFKSPPRAAEKTILCANDLYVRLVPWCQELRVQCRDLLDEIKGWLYTTDPDWYRKKGVALCDIDAKFERWQSAKTEELERANNPAPVPSRQWTSKNGQTRLIESVPNMAHAGDHLDPSLYDDEVYILPNRTQQGVYHA